MKTHDQLLKIQKELKAPKGQTNKFGNYNYRSCEDILEAVKPLLDGCTLVISDKIIKKGDRYYIKATVTLSDGTDNISNSAYAREAEDRKGMDSSQITGSTSSYARKYALNGLFAIDDTKDADTMNNSEKPQEPKPAYTSNPKLASDKQKKMIYALAKNADLETDEAREAIKSYFKIDSFNELTVSQASKAIENLQKKIEENKSNITVDDIDEEIERLNKG